VKRGDLAPARTAFEQVVKLAPASAEGHNSLGWVMFSQGQTAEAVLQIRQALRLKPNLTAAHINLANALAQSGSLADAESEARTAVRLAPQDSEAHRTLGRIASFRGDLNTATAELKKAVELDPKGVPAQLLLASVLVRLEQCTEHARDVVRVVELRRGDADAATEVVRLTSSWNARCVIAGRCSMPGCRRTITRPTFRSSTNNHRPLGEATERSGSLQAFGRGINNSALLAKAIPPVQGLVGDLNE
jgi:Tfp pilus assembly protein PilF